MKHITITPMLFLLAGCGFNGVRADNFVIFENSSGESISINRHLAIIRGNSYPGNDCSSRTMRCIDYSGYFSLISPRQCKDIDVRPWRAGSLVATLLGVDHHRSRTTYGVNRGEMVAYDYSWEGHGVLGLVFDSVHKVANANALGNMGYRDSSIFFEKVSGETFMACAPEK